MSTFRKTTVLRRRGDKGLRVILLIAIPFLYFIVFSGYRAKLTIFSAKYESEELRVIQDKIFPPPFNMFENIGEYAIPVKFPDNLPPNLQEIVNEGWKNHSFNMYLSDLISLERKLPDYRSEYCKTLSSIPQLNSYRDNLPSTSVIIIFYNEGWSSLLRSVHSVLNRSPPSLITEVILVDDASTYGFLKKPLDDYVSHLPKVKILRAEKREGLIRARLRGAAIAKGKVLTFLDAHIECTDGWLEPLLDRIAANYRNVVCPVITVINPMTFEFHYQPDPKLIQIGGFNTKLMFTWIEIPEREHKRRKNPSEPIQSPTMAGGLFSIDKEFFYELGGYDPGFDIWGCENLELSFKTWMCGGNLEIIPCSIVGHIFRTKPVVEFPDGARSLKSNSVRLAEVWMDEYAKYFYARCGKDKGDFGDISDRVKLRSDLQCKSFKWYIDNIYPQLELPLNSIAYGSIRNLGFLGQLCLDAPEVEEEASAIVYFCHGSGGAQYWEFTNGIIGRDGYALNYSGQNVTIKERSQSTRNQLWKYFIDSKQIIHQSSKKCLSIDKQKNLQMNTCKEDEEGQKWELENLDPKQIK